MVPSLFSYTWSSLKSCTSSDSVGGFACNIWVQWHSWLDGGQYKEIETREQIVWWAQTREPNLPQQPIVADAFFFLGLPPRKWIFKAKILLVSKLLENYLVFLKVLIISGEILPVSCSYHTCLGILPCCKKKGPRIEGFHSYKNKYSHQSKQDECTC